MIFPHNNYYNNCSKLCLRKYLSKDKKKESKENSTMWRYCGRQIECVAHETKLYIANYHIRRALLYIVLPSGCTWAPTLNGKKSVQWLQQNTEHRTQNIKTAQPLIQLTCHVAPRERRSTNWLIIISPYCRSLISTQCFNLCTGSDSIS